MNTDEQFRAILAGIYKQTADIQELDARVGERLTITTALIAYDQAREDPNAKLPSYLMAALEQLRRT